MPDQLKQSTSFAIRLRQRLHTATQVVRCMGVRWAGYRVLRAVAHRLHAIERRLPNSAWEKYSSPDAQSSLGKGHSLRSRMPLKIDRAALDVFFRRESGLVADQTRRQAESVLQGNLDFFSGEPVRVGWPPEWNKNRVDEVASPQIHFSNISPFAFGDIKNFWEPGRFGFVFPLVRAFARNQCDDAAENFWVAVEDFMKCNPPFVGSQWMCGQEVALRVFALFVGWSVFSEEAASTDARLEKLWQLLAASGRRIEGDIGYALSQKNNHGISEAAGLLLLGLVLPEHDRSCHWIRRGRELLTEQVRELVYPDGGFSQHSANYHRLLMQVLTFTLAVAGHQEDLPEVRGALSRSLRFLRTIQDNRSGEVPRYGHDDGALIFPWTQVPYSDFRPAAQEAAAVLGEPLPWPPGNWDEGVCWLGKSDRLSCRSEASLELITILPAGGLALLRNGESMACLRVPRPIHRPSHLDALHADIWWKGQNIAIDPGTFRYNAHPPWDTLPLARGPAHNVITAMGSDQAQSIGRFLFAPWPETIIRRQDQSTVQAEFCGHIGQIIRWTRSLSALPGDSWCIIDQVELKKDSTFFLHWHLADFPSAPVQNDFSRTFRTPEGDYGIAVSIRNAAEPPSAMWYAGEAGSVHGWYAPRYGTLARCYEARFTVTGNSVTCLTLFGSGQVSIQCDELGWNLLGNGLAKQIPYPDPKSAILQ